MSAIQRLKPVKNGSILVFMVGMRINKLWAIHKWLPVLIAMPSMIIELVRNRELGLLGTPRTFVSGRLIQVQQYWRSYEQLEKYAGAAENRHLPAWKRFNRAARGNAAVGIYHETYLVPEDSFEAIYVNVKRPILLGSAIGLEPITKDSNTSRQRLQKI